MTDVHATSGGGGVSQESPQRKGHSPQDVERGDSVQLCPGDHEGRCWFCCFVGSAGKDPSITATCPRLTDHHPGFLCWGSQDSVESCACLMHPTAGVIKGTSCRGSRRG